VDGGVGVAAVISPSALSLMYPPVPLADYTQDRFFADLIDQPLGPSAGPVRRYRNATA